MKKRNLLFCGLLAVSAFAFATPVKVTMNATSTTMSLTDAVGNPVNVGAPSSARSYEFDVEPGRYVLTAYDKNNAVVNGTIVLNVVKPDGSVFGDDLDDQYKDGIDDVNQFTVITCTAYVTNKHDDSTSWTIGDGDYTFAVKVNTREGEPVESAYGESSTKGRYTFLAFNGNSYTASFIPSAEHEAEGYMTLYRGGTLTANVNVSGAIPMGGEFSVEVPQNAGLELGMKFTHFTDFTLISPLRTEPSDNGVKYVYRLANGQVYNYRTWREGGLTNAGYFTMNVADAAKCPVIKFSDADFSAHDPKAINHSAQSNNGYETGDLLLNINPTHHLKLNPGEDFLVHGMRMWELSDNSTNNYFFEPDFRFTVMDTDFKPSQSVIEIENCSENNTSAWSRIKTKGVGTAIVLVTYDGINLNYYNGAEKRAYLGGEYWGAIWPENTGVFVVTVGEGDSSVVPNMTVNEKYNMDTLRLAGNNVDAEHDVFYYLDSEDGFYFTFKPEGVVSIDMATPEISGTEMKYTGFSSDGIVQNEDGSYVVLLKEGKTIIRMTDASGRSAYQVLRAKPCHREITNATRENSKIFQPGDKIMIQYNGLFHPANKIAGIYNMSAYVTYNGTPNGSSLILGSGQYTFGSAASAQAVTVEIPDNYDVAANPVWKMDEGVIQVNGYGDPIGNHRNTSPLAGRSPNFTAVPHKTYFGALPDIAIELTPVATFKIAVSGAPDNADIHLDFGGNEVLPDGEGFYSGTYGSYALEAKAEGYRCFRKTYEITDDAKGLITFAIDMKELGDAWDGESKSQPELNESGVYEIRKPSELAWFADNVNTKGEIQNAVLMNDIELGNFDWTPIGSASSNPFTGTFSGRGHKVSEIYINKGANYMGLFGYVKDGNIEGITVDGSVSGKQYVGGVAAYLAGTSTLDRCANYADVTGSGTYVGGVAGHLAAATVSLTNCYNAGSVTGTTNCGGVVGNHNAATVMENIFNVGTVYGKTIGACVGGTAAKNKLVNAFTTVEGHITDGQTLVSEQIMASGEVAYKLGEAFFQTLGSDAYPVFSGEKVYYDSDCDVYYNILPASILTIDSEGIELDLEDNHSVEVTASYGPAYSIEPSVIWTSSDEAVVSVEHDGTLKAKLTAVKPGKAILTVSHADNPEVFDSCDVTVAVPAGIEELIEEVGSMDVFDVTGKVILLDADGRCLRNLEPGLYILRTKDSERKILVR